MGGVIEITGTPEARRQQLSAAKVGDRVRINGKLFVKRAGGFEAVGAP